MAHSFPLRANFVRHIFVSTLQQTLQQMVNLLMGEKAGIVKGQQGIVCLQEKPTCNELSDCLYTYSNLKRGPIVR